MNRKLGHKKYTQRKNATRQLFIYKLVLSWTLFIGLLLPRTVLLGPLLPTSLRIWGSNIVQCIFCTFSTTVDNFSPLWAQFSRVIVLPSAELKTNKWLLLATEESEVRQRRNTGKAWIEDWTRRMWDKNCTDPMSDSDVASCDYTL